MKTPSFSLLFSVLLIGLSVPASAAVTFLPQYMNNMVLQRDQPVPIHGKAAPATTIHVSIGDKQAEGTTDSDGNWTVTLPPLTASANPQSLTASGDGEAKLDNILVGDVWVAAGQSNMEFKMAPKFGPGPGVLNAETEIPAADRPLIRFFSMGHEISPTPVPTAKGKWSVVTPSSVTGMSAVAYYFAVAIQADQNVPIGVICTYWGGTPVEAWTPADALEKTPGFAAFNSRWEAAQKTYPAEKIEFDKQTAAYNELKASGKPLPPTHPHAPAASPNRGPAAIYNAMVVPFTGMAIKGVIWYQGEENTSHADEYRGFFPAMITAWRAAWKRDDLPFLFVQLPNYKPIAPNPGPSQWAELRDAQASALSLPHTGMAVGLGYGDAKNIHPQNKKPIGEHLALAAREVAYGEKVEGSSPSYQSMAVDGGSIKVQMAHAPKGLKTSDGGPVKGFSIAGSDQKFHWAEATIDGTTITVHSAEVSSPVAVRYGWADNLDTNLVGGDDLPVGTFRSDNWPH